MRLRKLHNLCSFAALCLYRAFSQFCSLLVLVSFIHILFLNSLEHFIQSSNLGQYPTRLKLIAAFHQEVKVQLNAGINPVLYDSSPLCFILMLTSLTPAPAHTNPFFNSFSVIPAFMQEFNPISRSSVQYPQEHP